MIVSPWNMAMVLFLHTVLSQSSITGDPGKQCPSDSILTPEGDCKCALENCPSCQRGYTKTVVQKSLGVPGECCDQFTCAPTAEKNCANVTCPEMSACPSDSYRLPAITSENDCCPVSRGCQCLPTCETFICQNDMIPVIVAEGNNSHPGKCCPVYKCVEPGTERDPDEPNPDSRDCLSDSSFKKHGSNWTTSDFCLTCTCRNGEEICHAFACVPCLKPTPVAGQCCPRCDDTHVQPPHCPQVNCTVRCPYGNLEDENGCVTCHCRTSCPKDCISEADLNGEQICRCDNLRPCPPISNCDKKCVFGYQKDEFSCDTCECQECNKQCSRGYLTDEKGVSLCKCKPWSLHGSNSLNIEESRPCKTEENILRDSGETWFDGCRQCSCINGTEMCSLIHCSSFTCSKPIVNATSNCCPFCPDDPATNKEISHMVCSTPNGDIMLEGETSKLDDCTTCICHEGMALCRGEECPPTLCSNPKPPGPKECCPTCPALDEDDNTKTLRADNDVECSNPSANNTAWRESSCLSCQCIGNKKYCFTELCDSVSKCKRSLTIKGRCCPICIDEADKYKLEGMCIHSNSSHTNGEEWSVDQCTRCKCIAGRTECTKKVCPSSCSRASENLDRCCSACDASSDFHNMPEMLYIIVLLLVVLASVALVVCLTRHWRSKKQQIRLRDLSCYPPQYEYKFIPTSPYDNKSSQKIILSEKASLAPV